MIMTWGLRHGLDVQLSTRSPDHDNDDFPGGYTAHSRHPTTRSVTLDHLHRPPATTTIPTTILYHLNITHLLLLTQVNNQVVQDLEALVQVKLAQCIMVHLHPITCQLPVQTIPTTTKTWDPLTLQVTVQEEVPSLLTGSSNFNSLMPRDNRALLITTPGRLIWQPEVKPRQLLRFRVQPTDQRHPSCKRLRARF